MNYLVQSEFSINWATLVSLLVGLVLGAVLFVLFYTLFTLKQVKNTSYSITKKMENVTDEEINNLISAAQKDFLITKQEEKGVTWNNIRTTSLDLIKDIAKKFYPDSKEPLAELTLEEIVMLDHYIIEKIEKILDRRGLKPLQKLKLSTVINLINTKTKIEKNPVVKGVKKTGIAGILSSAWTAVKFLNPASWFKKLVIDPMFGIAIKSICLTIIRIIGQETAHVYSKQAFLEPVEEEEMKKLLENIHQYDEEIEVEEKDVITSK